jgi:hypothetical protein
MPAYPRDFFEQRKSSVDQALCFVLMPFGARFTGVWQIVKETVEEQFGLTCVRADQISRPGNIMEDVLEYIARAGTVVADLTDRNPNVFYELGIAHSVKPASSVYLLSQAIDFIPFDLRHLRCLVYEADLANLRDQLSEAFSQGTLKRYRITLREGERAKFAARVSGKDRCLYEVECEGLYLGDNGAKMMLRVTQFVAGREPEQVLADGLYLGEERLDFSLRPRLDWKLHFGGGNREEARVFLERESPGSTETS